MKIHNAKAKMTDSDFARCMIDILETDTQKDVFTIRFTKETDEGGLETIVVFRDKTILMGDIHMIDAGGHIAFRMKGKYI